MLSKVIEIFKFFLIKKLLIRFFFWNLQLIAVITFIVCTQAGLLPYASHSDHGYEGHEYYSAPIAIKAAPIEIKHTPIYVKESKPEIDYYVIF